MEITEVIKILEDHLKWRCDKNVPSIYKPTDPKELTEAMDTAISKLKSMMSLSDVVKRPTMGMIEMCIHDHCTTHNGKEEITNEAEEMCIKTFFEYEQEWLQISND